MGANLQEGKREGKHLKLLEDGIFRTAARGGKIQHQKKSTILWLVEERIRNKLDLKTLNQFTLKTFKMSLHT